MPYDRFGRFYEPPEQGRSYQQRQRQYELPEPPGADHWQDLANLPRAPGRFPAYPGQRYEDELTDAELNVLLQEGMIQRAPAPIGPQAYTPRRPNPWAIEQPNWYELAPRGAYERRGQIMPEQKSSENWEQQGFLRHKTEQFPFPLPTRGKGMEDYEPYLPEIPQEIQPYLGHNRRRIQPGGPPYVDRPPPSVWGPGPGYNAPMYPEDFRGKAEPIPIAPRSRLIHP